MCYLDLSPLRNNGWVYKPHEGLCSGRWIHPLYKGTYSTERALEIQAAQIRDRQLEVPHVPED